MSNSKSGKDKAEANAHKMLSRCFDLSNSGEIGIHNCANMASAGNTVANGYLEVDRNMEESKVSDLEYFENTVTTNSDVGLDCGDQLSSNINVIGNHSHGGNNATVTEGFSTTTDGIDGIGILNDESDKHLNTLRFTIPIPQAGPRPTSSILGSAYSTPGTFSISSRGCTSTAPSTAPSTCSLNSVSSMNGASSVVNVGGFASGQKGKSQNPQPVHQTNTPNGSINGKQLTPSSTGDTDSGMSNPNDSSISASNTSGNSTSANNDTTVDRIDSALLSALSDPREKYGLLRLEQTLVDFMNERTTGYIEVGGSNNSIVIGGQSGGRLANNIPNGGQSGLVGMSNNGECEGRIGKQTSFQRLCLHRLADRFNIVRESAASSWSTGTSSSSNALSTEDLRSPNLNTTPTSILSPPVSGLIRLVKVKNSRIPQNLLIDLDVSSYQQCSDTATASTRRGDSNTGISGDHGSDKVLDGVKEMTDNFAASSLENKASSVTFVKRQNSQPKQTMRIMKRNNGNSGNIRGNHTNEHKKTSKKNRNNLRGKNLSDKEKAYAEARARIFNESISTESGDNNNTNNIILRETDSSVPSLHPVSSLNSITRQTISGSPSSSLAPSEVEEDPETTNKSNNSHNSALYENAEGENECSSTSTSRSFVRDQNSQAAASATNGATSKVTWRNRRQEENDPDFFRGFNRCTNMPPQFAYGPAVTSGQSFVNGGSSNVQSSGYSHHGMIPQQHHQNPQVFYPSSHLRYNGNTSGSGGHYSHNGLGHSHSHQPSYYGSHTQASSYYSQQQQQSQHHQMRQNFHDHLSSGGGNSIISGPSSGTTHVGVYSSSSADAGSSTTPTGRRSENILHNMEEFPALR